MAKIVMRVSISGSRNGEDWPGIGETVDLPKAEAEAMVLGGMAVWPDDVDAIADLRHDPAEDAEGPESPNAAANDEETAQAADAEKATARRGGRPARK